MRRRQLILVAVCGAWGTIPLIVRHVDLPAAAIAAARVWLGAAGLALVLRWPVIARRIDPGTRPPLWSHRGGLCVASGVILGLHWAGLFAAFQRASAATVILVVYLAPIGVAALAPRVLGEVHRPGTLVALGVALAGLALVVAPDLQGARATGLALAAFAAGTFVVLLLLSKVLVPHYGGPRLALMELTGAGVALLPLAAFSGWGSPRPAWLWLLVLGLGHTAAAMAVYYAVLARVPATEVAILGYLEPVSVVLFGWAFLSEAPTATTLAGGALILAAGVQVVLASPRPEVAVGVPG